MGEFNCKSMYNHNFFNKIWILRNKVVILPIRIQTKFYRNHRMEQQKTKEEVLDMFKKAIEHKKNWQKEFEETYASPGMKVEFF